MVTTTINLGPITSAGRFSPLGPLGITRLVSRNQLFKLSNMPLKDRGLLGSDIAPCGPPVFPPALRPVLKRLQSRLVHRNLLTAPLNNSLFEFVHGDHDIGTPGGIRYRRQSGRISPGEE